MIASHLVRRFYLLIALSIIGFTSAAPAFADHVITVPSGPRAPASRGDFDGRIEKAEAVKDLVQEGAEWIRDRLVDRMVESNPRLQEARQKVQEAVASGEVGAGIVVVDLYDNRGVIGTRGVSTATGANLQEALENFVRQPSLEPLPRTATWTPSIEVVQPGSAPGSTQITTPFVGLGREVLINVHAQLRTKVQAAIKAQEKAKEDAKRQAAAQAKAAERDKDKGSEPREPRDGGRVNDQWDRSGSDNEPQKSGGDKNDRDNDKGNDKNHDHDRDHDRDSGPDIILGLWSDRGTEAWALAMLDQAPGAPVDAERTAKSSDAKPQAFDSTEAALRACSARPTIRLSGIWRVSFRR